MHHIRCVCSDGECFCRIWSESPKNTGEAVKKARASYGEQYLKIYQKEETKVSKIENAVTMAEAIALDDTHGYDQVDRWGNPNYDCSGLVINCLENAGIPVKQKGATYTGNMPEVLPNIGFKNVIASVNEARRCSPWQRSYSLLLRKWEAGACKYQ